MILRFAPASPFVRKVRIAIELLGLGAAIRTEAADTLSPTDSVRTQNPLGKIPALLLDDGTTLYDSRVILEYLDHRAGGGIILPRAPEARFAALRLQALADGMMDASVLIIYEGRFRPAEHRVESWVEHQAGKVARALTWLESTWLESTRLESTRLESDPPPLDGAPHVGDIALACALGYRDFRFQGTWRADHPRLTAWLAEFAARVPAFAATAPH